MLKPYFSITIYAILLLILQWDGINHLLKKWNGEEYNYCYLIPLIAAYILYEKRSLLTAIPSKPSWSGMWIVGAGIFMFLLGELGGEYLTLYLSLWLLIVGLTWLHIGYAKIKHMAFAFFILLFSFPLPNFFYNRLSLELKLISSQVGVWMLQAIGMSAYREGNVIDLGFTQLQVVDACSGLRYLIPLIVMGVLIAYFSKASLWKKIILVASTLPISIIVNSLRIASVGFLYQFWGQQAAEGFFHDFSGWFIFMLSLAILLVELWVLSLIGPKVKSPNTEKSDSPNQPANPAGAGKKPASLFQAQFIVAVILIGATLAASQGIEFREKIPIQKPFGQFPLQIGDWTGRRGIMELEIIDALDLSDYVTIDYENKDRRQINFYTAYYESQRKGESIHSPASCLPGGGWVFNEAGKADVALGPGWVHPVNRAVMQMRDYRQLSYFWYPMRGRILTNAYQMKFFNFWDALTRQRTDGALVRLITPIYDDEKLIDAEKRLNGFMQQMAPVLYQFLPDA